MAASWSSSDPPAATVHDLVIVEQENLDGVSHAESLAFTAAPRRQGTVPQADGTLVLIRLLGLLFFYRVLFY